MRALTNSAVVEAVVGDERRPLSALAALAVWLAVSALGWAAIAAVVSSLS